MKELSFTDFKKEVLEDYSLLVKYKNLNKYIEERGGELLEIALRKVQDYQDEYYLSKDKRKLLEALGNDDYSSFFKNYYLHKKEREFSLKNSLSLAYAIGLKQVSMFFDNKKTDFISFITLTSSHQENILSSSLLKHINKNSMSLVVTLRDTIGIKDRFFAENIYDKEFVFTVNAWDYTELCQIYAKAISVCKKKKQIVFVIVNDVPVHPEEILHMGRWIISMNIENKQYLDEIEDSSSLYFHEENNKGKVFVESSLQDKQLRLTSLLNKIPHQYQELYGIDEILNNISSKKRLSITEIQSVIKTVLNYFAPITKNEINLRNNFTQLLEEIVEEKEDILIENGLSCKSIEPFYDEFSQMKEGHVIMQENFMSLFEENPYLFVFTQGKIIYKDESNQLQTQLNTLSLEEQIAQAVGFATKGGQVIIETQSYIDFTEGLRKTEQLTDIYGDISGSIIFRTQEHSFFEGNNENFPYFENYTTCIPRDMVQAMGYYFYLLKQKTIALVIEPKQIYSQWCKEPQNIKEIYLSTGSANIMFSGKDITILAYGGSVLWAEKSMSQLENFDISAELIDLSCASPFDLDEVINQSINHTGKLLIVSDLLYKTTNAFLLKNILAQEALFENLLVPPITLEIKSDTTNEIETMYIISNIFNTAYKLMNKYSPEEYPELN